jgi:hypothetical protein
MAETLSMLNFVTSQFAVNVPSFFGYQNTSQTLANTSWTALNIDATVDDTYSGHSNSVNNSRYVCQLAGVYMVSGCYTPSGNTTGFRAVRVAKNGSPILGGSAYLFPITAAAVEIGCCSPIVEVSLSVGDYVEVHGWQSSGGNLGTVLDIDMRCSLTVRFAHF